MKTKKGKKLLKALAVFIAVIIVFSVAASVLTSVGNKANTEKVNSFPAVEN